VADFDAVIVGGGAGVQDYLRGGRYHAGAERLIAGMYRANEPVAALCMGPAVLAEVRVDGKSLLADRRATAFDHEAVLRKLQDAGARRVNAGVVVDGPIITARHWDDAEGLVGALLDALHRREGSKSDP
jgi:putative intracellular protease/amidase